MSQRGPSGVAETVGSLVGGVVKDAVGGLVGVVVVLLWRWIDPARDAGGRLATLVATPPTLVVTPPAGGVHLSFMSGHTPAEQGR